MRLGADRRAPALEGRRRVKERLARRHAGPAFDAIDFVHWNAADRREVEARSKELAPDGERLPGWCVAFAPLIAGARVARGDHRQLPLLRELTTSAPE